MSNSERAVRHASLRPCWMSGVAAILTAVLLSGCTRSSFLGRQFDDLTAHYNTFYNANRTFKEQEKKIEKRDPKIEMDQYLLIFEVPEVRGRSAEFEKVIDKSADLLRKHPRSKWVDDVLMLIGKSYFYQTNYVGAEQKFTELVALDGPLFNEAAFWLARTLVASQSRQAAEDVIITALSSERLGKKWKPRFHLLLGDLRAASRDWEGSIEALEAALPGIRRNDLASRAQFLLGQLYETIEDYPASVAAYRDVQQYKPLYELSFSALYSQFRVEGLHGDSEIAHAGLQKMLRDNKHYQYIDRIDYNNARVYAASGDPIAAKRLFRRTLYPPPGRRASSIRGEAHYRLAELYRDVIGDFYRSAAHFDTASSVLRTTRLQNAPYTPDAIINARAIAAVFATHRDVLEEVSEMDSLLHLGSLDDEAFDEAVRNVRQQLALEAARTAEELQRRQTQSSFQRAGRSEVSGRSQPETFGRGQQRQRFGFLNHKDIQRVQEAFLSFRQAWGDRPLIPGWRREEIVLSTRSSQQAELDQVDGPVQVRETEGAVFSFLPPVDISNVPRDSVSQAEMRSRRAAARYKLANVLFLSMSLPDSAAYWYGLVVEEDAGEPVAIRAQYAMAEVHMAVGDEESGEKLFATIIAEYPKSEFADRARVSLGIEIVSESADSLEIALAQYGHAYELWNEGETEAALDAMVRTAADNPSAAIAAKAMLAAGSIFSEMAQADSIDLFGVIPLGDSVFTKAELDFARRELTLQDSTSMSDSVTTAVAPDSQVSAPKPDSPVVGVSADEKLLEQMLAQENLQDPSLPTGDQPASTDLSPLFEPPGLDDRSGTDSIDAKVDPPAPSGEPLLYDDDLRLRTARTGDFERNLDDEDAILGSRLQEVESAETEDAETEDVSSSDSTGSDPVIETGPPPVVHETTGPAAPEKPDWIEVEYFVNAVIPQPLTLHALLASIEMNFQGTEYGDRASVLKRGLIAYRDESFAPPTIKAVEPGALGIKSAGTVSDTTLVSLDR